MPEALNLDKAFESVVEMLQEHTRLSDESKSDVSEETFSHHLHELKQHVMHMKESLSEYGLSREERRKKSMEHHADVLAEVIGGMGHKRHFVSHTLHSNELLKLKHEIMHLLEEVERRKIEREMSYRESVTNGDADQAESYAEQSEHIVSLREDIEKIFESLDDELRVAREHTNMEHRLNPHPSPFNSHFTSDE